MKLCYKFSILSFLKYHLTVNLFYQQNIKYVEYIVLSILCKQWYEFHANKATCTFATYHRESLWCTCNMLLGDPIHNEPSESLIFWSDKMNVVHTDLSILIADMLSEWTAPVCRFLLRHHVQNTSLCTMKRKKALKLNHIGVEMSMYGWGSISHTHSTSLDIPMRTFVILYWTCRICHLVCIVLGKISVQKDHTVCTSKIFLDLAATCIGIEEMINVLIVLLLWVTVDDSNILRKICHNSGITVRKFSFSHFKILDEYVWILLTYKC